MVVLRQVQQHWMETGVGRGRQGTDETTPEWQAAVTVAYVGNGLVVSTVFRCASIHVESLPLVTLKVYHTFFCLACLFDYLFCSKCRAILRPQRQVIQPEAAGPTEVVPATYLHHQGTTHHQIHL